MVDNGTNLEERNIIIFEIYQIIILSEHFQILFYFGGKKGIEDSNQATQRHDR